MVARERVQGPALWRGNAGKAGAGGEATDDTRAWALGALTFAALLPHLIVGRALQLFP